MNNDKYQDEDLRNCEGDSDREYKVQGVQSILHESCEEVYLMCNKKKQLIECQLYFCVGF